MNIWQKITEDLEDVRAATLITAIDYAKAFNRLSFQECLAAFARKGASTEVLQLISTFLTNRTMSVKIEQAWSDPLPVHGGVPQGSILGVFLFNITTDELELGADVDRLTDPPPAVDLHDDGDLHVAGEPEDAVFIHAQDAASASSPIRDFGVSNK